MQAVCDANLVFTNCFVGFAGSVHDRRVFARSDLWIEGINRNQEAFFPHHEYIIGDKAYPVLPWCIPSYIDRGNLTAVTYFLHSYFIIDASKYIISKTYSFYRFKNHLTQSYQR